MSIENIRNCCIYKSIVYMNKPIVIFESHNYALPIWGEFSCIIGKKLNLITFDRHTDTRAPFNSLIIQNYGNPDQWFKEPCATLLLKNKKYMGYDFLFDDVLEISKKIKNDEQIKMAYDFGYISSFSVVHKEQNVTYEYFEGYDKMLDYECKYIEYDEIDWDILDDVEEPIALDFDLDFFTAREDQGKLFRENVKNVVNRASVITIAKEKVYFDKGRTSDDFSNEEALDNIISIIKESLSDRRTKSTG